MTETHWTPEQKAAIETLAGDLLITAAAGAGKTAVLTGRCIHLLTNIEPPCSIDELLVLTYTEAAAAEMKKRIRSALYDRKMALPPNERMHRQLALLDQAQISTIHSFCNALLREYFYRLNIDPGFEVLDAEDADLLKLQIAEELLEEYYTRSQETDTSDDFARFVYSYSSGTGDRQWIDLLIRMNNFLETLSDHTAWTDRVRQCLQPTDPASLFVVRRQKELLKQQLGHLIRRVEHANHQITQNPALELYTRYLEQDIVPILREIYGALEDDHLDQALRILTENKTLKRIPNRPPDVADEHVEAAKDLIGQVKHVYKTLHRKLSLSPDHAIRQLHCLAPSIHLLLEIQQNFLRRYNQAKRSRNVLDFADLEHLALELLRNGDQPSEVALQIRDRFRFILVDEYQDISPIQESLLQTISRSSSGHTPAPGRKPHPGNLFMVGDVKQSIYSFRQADPAIFLAKLNQFTPYSPGTDRSGRTVPPQARIDLNKNFRARNHLINAVNYIFSRCMTPDFVGFDYQREAQLTYGAEFYDQLPEHSGAEPPSAVEVHLIEREFENTEHENNTTADSDDRIELDAGEHSDDRIERDAARREAAIVARRIRKIVGADRRDHRAEFDIVDPDTGQPRPVTYRDIVVLLRSVKMRAEIWTEVFQQLRVPVHAEQSGGFFVATEIQDVISLLQLLENPQQDIPMASVLRSPVVGLNESQLAEIRLLSPKQPYHHAVFQYAHSGPDDPLRNQLATFLEQLDQWRTLARRQPLAPLLWTIYRDVNLLACVSAMPQGRQRYRNLIHLHDRARQFDSFANRGLTRFLAFIEKLRAEEGDFGPAPVLTQADNVVRIMSVHKSKGLEFPVVILADLARTFNTSDLKHDIIYNPYPNMPVGLRLAAPASDHYPTLSHHLAAADKEHALLTEELRILYVAMTRAREHLVLVASPRLDKSRKQWQLSIFCETNPNSYPADPAPLPEFVLRAARSPLDWLGAALAGHPDARKFLDGDDPDLPGDVSSCDTPSDAASSDTPSGVLGTEAYSLGARFRVTVYDAAEVARQVGQVRRERDSRTAADEVQEWIAAGCDGVSISKEDMDALHPESKGVIERLAWRYPPPALTRLGVRVRVTELKRQMDPDFDPDFCTESDLDSGLYDITPACFHDRPVQMSAKEIGSCVHLFLQHLDLTGKLDYDDLEFQLEAMVGRGIVLESQREGIDVDIVARFFASGSGRTLLAHRATVEREWPFTLAMPIREVYPDVVCTERDAKEMVLIRGVIDCLFESEEGIWIVDFKTDDIGEADCARRAESYRVQMQLYRKAVERILDSPVAVSMLYFLRPGVRVDIPYPAESEAD